MPYPTSQPRSLEVPAWKSAICVISAVLLAILMGVAGVWKITAPVDWATRMNQALLPAALSLPAAIIFGVSETFSGILLLIPRFRRWGAILSAVLLLGFMGYFAIFYEQLMGDDCSCFPWIQRTVGPGFFISDAAMLLLAVFAYIWTPAARSLKTAGLILAAVAVFAGVSLGVALTAPQGKLAPETIDVAGQPFDLHEGKVLLYFFDPECTHCLFAARDMTGYEWADVKIIVVPTERKQLADGFLQGAGLVAPITSDSELLREIYSFTDPPFAVVLEDGRTLKELRVFEGEEPKGTLVELGFVR